MSRTVVRSLFPVFRTSSRRRIRPSYLRLTGPRQPTAGALGAALIALTVVAAVTVGVPASPAWADSHIVTVACTTGTFTVTDNVVGDGGECTGTATIPLGVMSIGFDAFRNPLLTKVTFAKDAALLTILDRAFDGSGLTSIMIPKSVTSVGMFAFASTSALTSVTFEEGSVLATIGTGAFTNMGLRSVVIPQSVTAIGNFAFKDNQSLTSVRFEGDEPTVIGAQVFADVASGATATVGLTATGFEVDSDGFWEGLFLVRAAAPSAPAAAPSVPIVPALACMPEGPPAVGALVTCTVTGGDAGIDILWRAAYNPTFAGAGVTLDASGSGEFSFVVPAAAFGQAITVELVDWAAPVSLGVAGGPVPTSVPSGGGPVPVWSLLLPALVAFGLLRRGMRAEA
jgi:hypothetical protein